MAVIWILFCVLGITLRINSRDWVYFLYVSKVPNEERITWLYQPFPLNSLVINDIKIQLVNIIGLLTAVLGEFYLISIDGRIALAVLAGALGVICGVGAKLALRHHLA